jgi:hypothetical protein
MFGVMAAGVVPWHPIQSFMSSTAMNNTLGLFAPRLSGPSNRASSRRQDFLEDFIGNLIA